ncbi:hypothetical protein BEP19_14955 [Ammoniphilus oxalaticus]|uniref:Rubredoxin-like domain-containing protein n=1 Tax=Ammoniphilus oxalaticus TaxID=66863 RepID=A0A419SDB3_9BACL|nr:hypothetical protein [Ammoniphilus oxalaticus]RKD20980.1 hypothetical protein BEP19_14955 [Ammoniphilus oxalaticus]
MSIDADRRVYMHLYECTKCSCVFAVIDDDEMDQDAIVCPHCQYEEHLKDKSYGVFVATV